MAHSLYNLNQCNVFLSKCLGSGNALWDYFFRKSKNLPQIFLSKSLKTNFAFKMIYLFILFCMRHK